MMQYLETDTILWVCTCLLYDWVDSDRYHDDGTGAPALESMQKQHWHPLLSWMSQEFDVELALADGFLPASQEPAIVERLRKELDKMSHWELAGQCNRGHVQSRADLVLPAFERAAYASKSFVIALGLCKGRLTADQAADASHVEVRSQIERWGEVEDCEHSKRDRSARADVTAHDVDYQDIRRMLGSCAVSLLETP